MPYGTYYYGIDLSYFLLLIPVLIFSLWAQAKVQSTFRNYNAVTNARRMTGYDAARLILDRNGLSGVRIEHIAGNLTDHYDPKTNVIRLSDSVYNTPSIAAVGVAAHEAGHAVQYAVGYGPIKLRASIVGATQFASKWSVFILLFGLLLSNSLLAYVGFWLYVVVAFFQLITLPVEFNASRRALTALEEGAALDRDELSGAKSVLSAAAMTYVAALLSALVQLLRLWGMVSGNNNRRRR
ncbi:MAG: zinc metallopeptidase [Clostridia bacterium]|nr:zinc metallopeptidase [Clostridia bacterium]